jgi:REP element-mobilizing transposase RayT
VARKPRLDSPETVHHVWVRGVVRRPIFADDGDRFALRDLIERSFLAAEARALTWVFMTNHLHMVIRTGSTSLSAVMQIVLSAYAREFNRRHEGAGHVFQGRFGSRRIDGDSDLRRIVRYVLRNPIEAGIVPDTEALKGYRWCGYAALLRMRAPFRFEDPAPVWALFDGGGCDALRAWIAENPASASRSTLYMHLIEDACREFGVTSSELLAGSRRPSVSSARTAICRRGVLDLGFSNAEIARRLRISRAAVTQALRRC